ncbi:precorrin-3B C(17)-methyltransferase [Alkalibacter rhizosphaerae]|uniref:Precorrin-3B C(17)-methyltransferase n=1 Tax=Alkalibacter rhizosphaerae TaxID=2815577 RepID=A0A974XFC1_9FIRM|nr:precorrin-3B C(17)-methyltransferase [Alkalibacter rhizosphaerae]QSX08819.1 precorrin-3B C(17)-methyltransferase [Alkalibacter rhizosphaerae]
MYKINVIGIGPGFEENMTGQAIQAIKDSQVVVGYKTYMELIRPLTVGKEIVENGMTREVERCKKAIELAMKNKVVSVVSSGDPGVYGMAGLILEILAKEHDLSKFDVAIIPGVTSANAGAAILGSPLMHDYVTISLSDLMTDWSLIEKRIHCAGQGDFGVVFYNPKSKSRPDYLNKAQEILLQYKSADTIVGIVKNAFRDGQIHQISTLGVLDQLDVDMFTTVFIGNSATYVENGHMITPRGYQI